MSIDPTLQALLLVIITAGITYWLNTSSNRGSTVNVHGEALAALKSDVGHLRSDICGLKDTLTQYMAGRAAVHQEQRASPINPLAGIPSEILAQVIFNMARPARSA